MLLTAGRASPATLAAARAAYGAAGAAGANAALRRMQMAFLAAPEFHATGALVPPGPAAPPPPPLTQAGTDADFRAVVVLYLSDGADSYSLLVPHSNCTGPADLYAKYATARSGVDIVREALLPVDDAGGTQPCRTFGLHPSLARLAALYDAGEAVLVANVGQLYEPLHARQVRDGEKRPPIGAFGHNSGSFAARRVAGTGTLRGGVLGRLASKLDLAGLRSAAFSLAGSAGVQMLEGGDAVDVIDPTRGTVPFAPPSEAVRAGAVAQLANQTAALHAGVYAAAVRRGIAHTKELTATLAAAALTQPWGDSALDRPLRQAARLLASRRALGLDRATVYVQLGGFDLHSDEGAVRFAVLMDTVDASVGTFVAEMTALGLHDRVVLTTASEFGRTYRFNGRGTDHGWGGNHLLVGGPVRGGRIWGAYPTDLLVADDRNIGQGRFVPSVPWEGVWHAVAQWMGVGGGAAMGRVLPNLGAFPPHMLLNASAVFR